jgi:hypothetical protein
MVNAFLVSSKTDPYDVYIGRGSSYGNPYSWIPGHGILVDSREDAIRLYEEWVREQPELISAIKNELKGKILGCPGSGCPYLGCHGEVLLRILEENN